MTPKNWIITAVVVLVIAAGGYWLYQRNQGKQTDQHVAQSIAIDQQHKAQTAASAKVDTVVDTLWRTSRGAVAAANRIHTQADTAWQHIARTIADSSNMWHLRWQLRGVENDSLRVALKADTISIMVLTNDRNAWHAVADSAHKTMDDLRTDLARARRGCQILPFVPCPPRLVVGLLGVAVGVAIADPNIIPFRKKK